MKISCEHCGTQIDVEKDRNCPHCGAPYSRNKEYDEIKNYKKKKEDLNIESHELQNKIVETTLNNFNSVSKISKVVFIFSAIVFLIIFITAITFIMKH